MAMLLDGPPSTIADLSARDSDLLNVSAAEGIDLTAKLQLLAADLEHSVESTLISMLPSGPLAGQRFPSLRQITVTPQLRLWHTFATLRAIYQDLFYSRLNDRYHAKMKMYGEEESRALDNLRTVGFGVVFDPLPQAVAPTITMVQSTGAGGTIYAAVSYVNKRGEQGVVSVPVEADIPAGTVASISLTALADNACGWNVFAGVSPDLLLQQNTRTLDPLETITVAPGNLAAGPKPELGQKANLLYPIPQRILRG